MKKRLLTTPSAVCMLLTWICLLAGIGVMVTGFVLNTDSDVIFVVIMLSAVAIVFSSFLLMILGEFLDRHKFGKIEWIAEFNGRLSCEQKDRITKCLQSRNFMVY